MTYLNRHTLLQQCCKLCHEGAETPAAVTRSRVNPLLVQCCGEFTFAHLLT